MEEKGVLIIGFNHGGNLHKEFSLRPQKVKDTLKLLEEDEKAGEDDRYFGLLTLSFKLSIDGVPKDEITTEKLLDMYQDDLDEIMAADERLKKKIARFRKKAAAPEGTDIGGQETGVPGG